MLLPRLHTVLGLLFGENLPTIRVIKARLSNRESLFRCVCSKEIVGANKIFIFNEPPLMALLAAAPPFNLLHFGHVVYLHVL